MTGSIDVDVQLGLGRHLDLGWLVWLVGGSSLPEGERLADAFEDQLGQGAGCFRRRKKERARADGLAGSGGSAWGSWAGRRA
jgi:hypothetical protein